MTTGTSSGPGKRVRITSPRRDARRRGERRTARAEFEAQTAFGAVYLAELVTAQRRLALAVLSGVLTTIAGIPLLLIMAPPMREVTVWWIPLPWLVVGVALYPVVLLAAYVHRRQSERIESDLAEFLAQQP